MIVHTKYLNFFIIILLSINSSLVLASDDFAKNLERVLKEHTLIKMVDADVATANAQIGVEKTAYFPKVVFGAGSGQQTIKRTQGAAGSFNPSEANIGLNQLLTDFGHTGLRVQAAETVAGKEDKERELQKQNLILAAIEAQLQLIRADLSLRYAQQSEANIKRQTSLENARMDAGRGYATDVLQSKAQLAGSEARRVIAESQLGNALNRYRAVFGNAPANVRELQALTIPPTLLMNAETEIDAIIFEKNPDVVAANSRAEVTLAERHVQRAKELAPRLALQVNQIYYQDYDGVKGNRDDFKAMVRLDWAFDLGMKAFKVTETSDLAVVSAKEKAAYVVIQAIEEGHNAWVNLQSSRQRTIYLDNQVQIAAHFLDLARKERELGRRSLMDILNGEVVLINAQSEATTARVDEVIAAYRLLRVTGKLSTDIARMPGVLISVDQLVPASTEFALIGAPGTRMASVTTPVIKPVDSSVSLVPVTALIKPAEQATSVKIIPSIAPTKALADFSSSTMARVKNRPNLKVTSLKFVGNRAISNATLTELLTDVIGKEIADSELAAIADRVTLLYAGQKRSGVIASANVRRQDGLLTIVVRRQQR